MWHNGCSIVLYTAFLRDVCSKGNDKMVKRKESKSERFTEKDKRRQCAKEKRKIEAQAKKYELKPIPTVR
jgi:hypothetical protein